MEKSNHDIDWEEVIPRLEAFTRSLVKKKSWFRGGNIDVYLKGKEIRDYVYDAIGKYLRNPGKYDPSKGGFVHYLELNLIRSLVSNDVTSEENLTSKDVFRYESDEEDNDNSTYLDRILPIIEPLFSDELDYNFIKEYIQKKIEGDKIVEEIFIGIYSEGMKRKDIIDEFNMSEKDYDNGIRRLQTQINEAKEFFNVNSVTV